MVLALLLCCADTVLVVQNEVCVGWDLDDAPELLVEATNKGFDMTRMGVEMPCDSIFEPDVEVDGRQIQVFEVWDRGPDDTCTLCYAPTVQVEDPRSGTLTLEWYAEDDDTTPAHTLEYDPDVDG